MSIGEPDQRESRHLEGSENKRSKRHFKESLIMRIKQQVDLLLIAGDLFDQPPTQQELREVDYLLSRLNHTRTVLIAGNHDHLEPHDAFSQYKWNSEVLSSGWKTKEIIFLLKILKQPFMALVIGRIRSRNHCMTT